MFLACLKRKRGRVSATLSCSFFLFSMSRIKGTAVKRATFELLKKYPDRFTGDYEENKKKLERTIDNKKIKNSIAGYLARLIKKQRV